jgi:hypothetical protein
MKSCLDGRIECLSASPRGFESGDSNLSKLTDVFAAMQLTGPGVSLRLVMPIPLATKLSIFKTRKEYASNWHPSVPALATRSGAAPRIGIYSPGIGNTLGGCVSNWYLFARRWQHARGLRLALASIRPALATRSGASPRIGIYSPDVSNLLGGYTLRC